MATVETWVTEHDKVCGERYRLLLKVIGFGGALLLATVTAGAGLFHEEQAHQTQMLQSISAQISGQVRTTSVTVNPTQVSPAQ